MWAGFGPSDCEDFDEALSRVKQVRRDFEGLPKEFEKLGSRVRGWTQKALIGAFMGGLKAEITDGIWMFKPKTLKDAIGLARVRDDQLRRQRKLTRPPIPARAPLALPPAARDDTLTPATPIKRISWEEMQKRRAQGLCFHCNDRFTAGHRCKKPQLLLLEDQRDAVECKETSVQQASEVNQEAVVLIDSGLTHNFISECLASMLRLLVVSAERFIVRVANGEKLTCQGCFDKVW